MTLGIIDVGTNSIHLVVGIIGLDGRFHVLIKERELARLGSGGLATRRLTKTAMRRAEKVLERYKKILDRMGVDRIEAVATSAVREASNGRTFVRRIREKMQLPLRVISGHEEGRLIYLGVLQTAGLKGPTLMVSIGGGSAEVMVGDGQKLRFSACRPLGCARLAEQFIRHDPPRPEEIEQLERTVRHVWRPVIAAALRHRWHAAIGTSATIQQMLAVAAARFQSRRKIKDESPAVSREALKKLVMWLKASTAAMRKRLPGLDPKREDLALATGVALLEFMDGCRIDSIRHAPGSLREGLVVDYLMRHHKRRSRPFKTFEGIIASGNGELTRSWRKRIMPLRSSEK